MRRRGIRVRAAVCVTDGEHLLMVEHRRGDRRYWLLPGGGVEVGETLAAAAAREAREETGFEVEIGRLLIVCEAIEPHGRHLVNPIFSARVLSGELRPGLDGRLVGAAWQPLTALPALETYPPIAATLVEICTGGGGGEVRFLGNVWSAER